MSVTAMESIAFPAVQKLSERVIAVLGQNPGQFTLQGTNTYIIGTGSRRILLDTGEGVSGYQQLLLNTLQAAGVTSISHILCTHRHHDHIGGISQVQTVVSALKQNPSTLEISKRLTNRDTSNTSSFQHIQNGQIYKTEGATLEAIYTPGHTDDHVSFLIVEDAALFTGDCVLGQGSAVFENLSQLIASLKSLQQFSPQRIYPGHGPCIMNNGVDKIVEYINHRLEREKQILALMQSDRDTVSSWTLDSLATKIYAGYPDTIIPAAKATIRHHLEKLQDDGIVSMAVNTSNKAADSESWRLSQG
ncbi:hypothetical protein BATDEDRAFT_86882 [Batrachochytrium dendrobatidis JAM81]|uniref:Metallo-beta-lactamase domain-containing protein n=1 Tax=Batrachochytrium dendrobatidis (strain JAM81 / FGSC 10211) TaxID=684364 RepID=F4NZ54_BATDJ|nr:uncharacterized protein BATDEDRAFT_86882 [Batrachochytrium dendrobatidis JAM81]EGF81825.1 hypothetical protein BATDEDRAFT_86882 [Batrachochytrium dendrobatidis JAM81]|eukprot:XP_006677546.1 hypothetical protein BATDEDRAFT_86882 [Batrachochytrium dendrobatidis JAM81]